MKKILSSLALAVLLLLPTKALAWGLTGHRVIAEIAERNLSKKAMREVKDLLDDQHMAYWANWPDFIKSDTTGKWKHTSVWHYVNTPGNLSKKDFLHFLQHENTQESAYSILPVLMEKAKDVKLPKEQRKEALVFLIHIAGDFHQPMHSGRAEDRGGNKIKVKWFGKETNLHSLWDGTLVDFDKYSYTEYAEMLNNVTDKERTEIQSGTLDDWFYDVHTIANRLYAFAETPEGKDLSYRYNYEFRDVIEGQLQKGGLRLAKILNDMFE